jgi:hypothetical protein
MSKKMPWPTNYIASSLHVPHMKSTYNEHTELQK